MLLVPRQIAEINHAKFSERDNHPHGLFIFTRDQRVLHFVLGLEFSAQWICCSRARQRLGDCLCSRCNDLEIGAFNWEMRAKFGLDMLASFTHLYVGGVTLWN